MSNYAGRAPITPGCAWFICLGAKHQSALRKVGPPWGVCRPCSARLRAAAAAAEDVAGFGHRGFSRGEGRCGKAFPLRCLFLWPRICACVLAHVRRVRVSCFQLLDPARGPKPHGVHSTLAPTTREGSSPQSGDVGSRIPTGRPICTVLIPTTINGVRLQLYSDTALFNVFSRFSGIFSWFQLSFYCRFAVVSVAVVVFSLLSCCRCRFVSVLGCVESLLSFMFA